MQSVFRISMIVLILMIFQTITPVSALEDGAPAGEVASINKKSKEIIINLADTGRGVKMGDRFYIRIDGEIVVMTSTFPMMTTSKCRLEAKYSKYLNSIVKEMKVYRYKKGADDKNNPAGRRTRNQKFGDLELIYLDGGVFVMGIPKEEKERSFTEDQHEVNVLPFYISKFEITQKIYQDITGRNPSYFKGDDLPAERINWYDAVEFCNELSKKYNLDPYYIMDKNKKDPVNISEYDKLRYTVSIAGGNGFRLPTAEEWEYACRAGTTTLFHYGDSLNSDMANFDGALPYNSTAGIKRNKTMPVGSFTPNEFGIYDMHGNVTEWTWDWFNDGYYTVVENNVIIKSTARITRGGSWNSNSTNLRSGRGYGWGPHSTSNELGIRVVRSVN